MPFSLRKSFEGGAQDFSEVLTYPACQQLNQLQACWVSENIVPQFTNLSDPLTASQVETKNKTETGIKISSNFGHRAHRPGQISLTDYTRVCREGMNSAGLTTAGVDHPICPVMVGEALLVVDLAAGAGIYERGVYVVAFSHPVVPKGKARVRVQISAAHTLDDVNQAVQAFVLFVSYYLDLRGHNQMTTLTYQTGLIFSR